MKNKKTLVKFIFGMITILITAAVLLTAVPSAYAEGTGPLSPIPGLGRLPNETLIRMHNIEGNWVREQASMFYTANDLSKTFQALINAEAKKGKNVTILKDALVVFDSELTAVQEIHNLAGVVVFNLVGWKANGDVRDRQAAGQSLLEGRTTLRDANFRMTNAMAILRKSFAKWRASRISVPPMLDVDPPPPTH
jgi:hypothetical protein